jgi:hypothetical protein
MFAKFSAIVGLAHSVRHINNSRWQGVKKNKNLLQNIL